MANIWTPRRPEMSEALIRVASPVSHLTWQASAYLANYLRGKGACLVPWCAPMRTIADGVTETFRFRVRPRDVAIARVWGLQLRTTAAAGVTVEVASPSGGTAVTYAVASSLDARTPITHAQALTGHSGVEAQIEVTIKAIGGAVIVEGLCCCEQDRPLLNSDATDYGVDVVTLATGQPIFDASNVSFGGIMDALANADARRVGIFHWTVGDGEVTNSSSTHIDLLPLGVPGLAQKIARAATTGAVKWSAYAKADAGDVGEVTLTTSESGVNDTAPVGTSYAWTAARTVSIDCEDLAADDGLQGGVWDELQISIGSADNTNACRVKSVSVWIDDI